jgi:glycosyltransferase involved in cell wall biosynthesis
MGPYWYNTLETSFLGRWKKKIVPLDMAVDAMQYPMLKQRFNPPGERGYFYIGSNRPEKGCDILGQTMAELTDFTNGWIGPGPDIPHMQRIATHAELTSDFVSKLAEGFDFFVNTSISDANPTTILEAMAWGFPVACTPQSGYYNMPSVVTLSTTDIQANVKALLELQYRPEEELVQISLTNRQLVETRYTWIRFCDTVWRSLQGYI